MASLGSRVAPAPPVIAPAPDGLDAVPAWVAATGRELEVAGVARRTVTVTGWPAEVVVLALLLLVASCHRPQNLLTLELLRFVADCPSVRHDWLTDIDASLCSSNIKLHIHLACPQPRPMDVKVNHL